MMRGTVRGMRFFVNPCTAVLLSMACLTAALGSPAWGSGKDGRDLDITMAVENSLSFDPTVPAHRIDVRTNEGIVTLSGSVNRLLAKDRAVALAGSIKGVRSVVDTVRVDTPTRSDRDIRLDIENALLDDPATDSYEIRVAVDGGRATLSGTVDSFAESRLAVQVAKKVAGVKAIENKIDVRYQATRPDPEIKYDVIRRLESDVFVDHTFIEVEVNEGTVTLTGTAGSLAEKRHAYGDAWVAGVRSVDAGGLEVKGWARDKMRKKLRVEIKPDEEIEEALRRAFLYDPRVASFRPEIQVDRGVVTLRGTVDNLAAKRAAGQDAWNTAGVRRVENRLKVRIADPPSALEISKGIQDAFQRDYALQRYDFTVQVVDQKVFLYGTVDTHAEKRYAEYVAGGIPGVSDVKNMIMVTEPWDWKSDPAIKEDVEGELFWSPFVDSEDIIVEVEDGDVTLTGVATDPFEADVAVQNAFEGGARSVRARIDLADGSDFDRYYEQEYDYVPRYDITGFPY